MTASLIKECTGLISQGPVTLLTGWQPYALVVAGASGLLFNQLAYQAGPLSASLPAIAVVDPLIAILLGITVFDEHLRHSLPAIIGEVVFLGLLVVLALWATMARSAQRKRRQRPSGASTSEWIRQLRSFRDDEDD